MKNLIKIIFVLSFLMPMCAHGQSITWQKLYNGKSNTNDYGRGICESADGNIYITGFLFSDKAIVLKLKPNGDTIWIKYYDGLRGDFIIPTNDGGCIITGQSSLVYTLRLDSNGNSIWLKTYPGSNNIITTDMIKTNDGGYAISGFQGGVIPVSAYVLKIDSLGSLQWYKYFGPNFYIQLSTISETNDNGYILAGYRTECEFCTGEPFLLKLNNSGDSLWEKKYALLADFKKIYSYQNEFLIGGSILDSPYIYANSFIMRTNSTGDINYMKIIVSDNREVMKDFKIINENKYVLACDTDSLNITKSVVYITDSLANPIYRNYFSVRDYTVFYSIVPLQNGDIALSGTANSNILLHVRDIFAVRTDSTLFAKPVGIKEGSSLISLKYELSQNYPNPFNPVTKIKYTISNIINHKFMINIYNVSGKLIESYPIKKYSTGEIIFNGKYFSSGVYFYSLTKDGNILETKKMLNIK